MFSADPLPLGQFHDSYRSDNGRDVIATFTAMLLPESKCRARFIQTRKHWQIGFTESVHSALPSDYLVVEVFFNLMNAYFAMGVHRNDYSQLRMRS
jgi:hypothetical protein